MSHADYRTALANIATAEADGEDVSRDIAHLASRSKMTVAMIRHEVTEIADDQK